MKIKFAIGFAILGLSLASAKSYEINVDTVSKVGNVELKPGAYKVSLDGSKVKFTDENTGKSVETMGTVESNGKAKFEATAIETAQENGVTKVHEIDLGGTTTKVKFQ